MTETVLFERKDNLAVLTLNRPDQLNSIDEDMRNRLQSLLHELSNNSDVRVILLKGAGERAFCAGADIKGFSKVDSTAGYRNQRLDGHWIHTFETVRQPIIAAIHGYCLGGGLEIAMACDIRIASEDAQLALHEVTHGIIPGAGGTQRLARLIGMGPALYMTLSAERIPAAEAHRIGLVSKVVPRGELETAAEQLATKIAGFPPLATRYAKEAVKRGFEMPYNDGMALEIGLSTLLTTTEDRLEAAAAFREKRKPVFKGR